MEDFDNKKKSVQIRIPASLHKRVQQIALDKYGYTHKHVSEICEVGIREYITKLENQGDKNSSIEKTN